MILVIDNYDSFTYNLVHYLNELGAETHVARNDALSVIEALGMRPQGILLSPGPKTPNEAGICLDLIAAAPADLPIFGVCLGHQSIGQAYGGAVVHAKALMHGKTSLIHHDGKGVFAGLKNPFTAARYHSLAVEKQVSAARPGGHGLDRGRRDHGPATQKPTGLRRAVPSRIDRHGVRIRPAGQLPRLRRRPAPGARLTAAACPTPSNPC